MTPCPLEIGKLPNMPDYTERQGQYLAFIYYYTRLNGRPAGRSASWRRATSFPT
jgi:hypothetical protein